MNDPAGAMQLLVDHQPSIHDEIDRRASTRDENAIAGRHVQLLPRARNCQPSVTDGDEVQLEAICGWELDGPVASRIERARPPRSRACYAAVIGDGANVWPAVDRRDAARLYRLAIECGEAGCT